MSFTARKVRTLKSTRFARDSDSEEEGKSQSSLSVEEAVKSVKTWQILRKRKGGISAESLYGGKKVEQEAIAQDDPFKMQTGGLVSMKGTFKKPMKEEFEDEVRLSKTFTAETNKRDEDADMLKYIDRELAKRKGITEIEAPKSEVDSLLAEIPETLAPKIGEKSEDMLSNQMLCGIPEVDLGVESKMRNIEATEEAKQRLLKERFSKRQKLQKDELAPFNMSVNFVQHSRWNNYADQTLHKELTVQLSDTSQSGDVPKPPTLKDPTVMEVERRRLQAEKSTDAQALQRYKNYTQNKRGR